MKAVNQPGGQSGQRHRHDQYHRTSTAHMLKQTPSITGMISAAALLRPRYWNTHRPSPAWPVSWHYYDPGTETDTVHHRHDQCRSITMTQVLKQTPSINDMISIMALLRPRYWNTHRPSPAWSVPQHYYDPGTETDTVHHRHDKYHGITTTQVLKQTPPITGMISAAALLWPRYWNRHRPSTTWSVSWHYYDPGTETDTVNHRHDQCRSITMTQVLKQTLSITGMISAAALLRPGTETDTVHHCTANPIHRTVYSTHRRLNSMQCTELHTQHSELHTQHSELHTQHTELHTQHSELCTQDSEPVVHQHASSPHHLTLQMLWTASVSLSWQCNSSSASKSGPVTSTTRPIAPSDLRPPRTAIRCGRSKSWLGCR